MSNIRWVLILILIGFQAFGDDLEVGPGLDSCRPELRNLNERVAETEAPLPRTPMTDADWIELQASLYGRVSVTPGISQVLKRYLNHGSGLDGGVSDKRPLREVGAASGVPYSIISRFLHGTRRLSPKQFVALLRELGCSKEEINSMQPIHPPRKTVAEGAKMDESDWAELAAKTKPIVRITPSIHAILSQYMSSRADAIRQGKRPNKEIAKALKISRTFLKMFMDGERGSSRENFIALLREVGCSKEEIEVMYQSLEQQESQ